MKPSEDTIKRFLKNKCTDAEAEAVDRFFRENPDELERYLPVNAWLTNPETQMSPAVSDRILQQIREKYKGQKSASRTAKIARYVTAASIAGLVIWMGLKLFTASPEKKAVAVYVDTANVLKTIENKMGKVMRVNLPDGSAVALYPNSQLQYLPAFEEKRRALYLKGKAEFNVSKNKARPFTVYASCIATTALGTQFLVSVLEDQQVSVKLKEGIVKVTPQYSEDERLHVVLHPGDQLIVNSARFLNYSLTHKAVPATAIKKNEKHKIPATLKDTLKGETRLVFKNQPLKEVFSKVEERFGVTIDHKNLPGIEEKLFTGIFLENDSLKFICDLICKMHSLHYKIEGHTVTIEAN